MSKQLKCLFVPVDGVGHFNACIGIASVLRDRGHIVTFAAPFTWKGKLEAQGFREELYTTSDERIRTDQQAGETWGEMVAKVAPVFSLPPIEAHEAFYLPMFEKITDLIDYGHPQLQQIVKRVQPDVMILDVFQHTPALMESGIPWILSVSVTPLSISRENVPPPYAGYATDGDREEWKKWEERISKVYKNYVSRYNKWLVANGSQEAKFSFPYTLSHSPYANIYMYPEELDYTAFRPNPPNFYRFDAFVRSSDENFEIPTKITKGPGKLIYFSMGTIGCIEVELMKRLIGILSKSPNRFIVSKGPRGNEFDLGDNMWGDNNVPQLSIIPLVDLVITHGGNNTTTESFYFGKRVLVLPLLFDQPDNAQRIYETGLGLRFHPYKVAEEELLGAIETLLGDDLLERRMKSISQRIQASNSQSRVADLVEKVARNNKDLAS